MDPEVERLMMMQQGRGGQQRTDATTPDKYETPRLVAIHLIFVSAEKWFTFHLLLCSKSAEPLSCLVHVFIYAS